MVSARYPVLNLGLFCCDTAIRKARKFNARHSVIILVWSYKSRAFFDYVLLQKTRLLFVINIKSSYLQFWLWEQKGCRCSWYNFGFNVRKTRATKCSRKHANFGTFKKMRFGSNQNWRRNIWKRSRKLKTISGVYLIKQTKCLREITVV